MGSTFPLAPIESLAAGAAAEIPLLVGTTRDEWTMAVFSDPRGPVTDRATLLERARAVFGAAAEKVVEVYESARHGASATDLYCAFATDQYIRIPLLRLADAQCRGGGSTYVYEFAWPSTAFGGILKACHSLEIPFVFDTLDQPFSRLLTGDDPPQALSDTMHRAWIEFASSGDPGWSRYDVERRPTMVFDSECILVDDLRGEERILWDGVLLGRSSA